VTAEFCRIDRWLWAVRVFRSRSISKDACVSGSVRINSDPAKPAAKVKIGDRVIVRVNGHKRELEVKKLLEKRVSPALATECYHDHTPFRQQTSTSPSGVQVAKRDQGSGRPTKRDRRRIDRLRRAL
jgi:ribosome-associated heat shock protein Hsp15